MHRGVARLWLRVGERVLLLRDMLYIGRMLPSFLCERAQIHSVRAPGRYLRLACSLMDVSVDSSEGVRLDSMSRIRACTSSISITPAAAPFGWSCSSLYKMSRVLIHIQKYRCLPAASSAPSHAFVDSGVDVPTDACACICCCSAPPALV